MNRSEALSQLLQYGGPKTDAFTNGVFGLGINDRDTANLLLTMVATLKERGFVGDNYVRVAQEFFASVAKPPEVPATPAPEPEAPVESSSPDEMSDPIWVGDWYGDNPWSAVRAAAEKAGDKRFVFISYNVPKRDLGQYSAGGLATREDYWRWTGVVADAAKVGRAPICILEPDALGHSREMAVADRDARFQALQGAIDAYTAVGIEVWVDASMWVPVPEMAALLKRLKGQSGFAINVSGWEALAQCHAYGDELTQHTGLPYVIDTSRNGNGNPHKPAWCNVTDSRVGHAPTSRPTQHCAAYLWLKKVGESDGLKINGYAGDGQSDRNDIPRAGEFWPEFDAAIRSGEWGDFKKRYNVK